MSKFRIIITIVISFLAIGCATTKNFDAIPISEQEFNKPLDEIRAEFSDVGLFENHWRGFTPIFGNITDLENKWGRAEKTEKKWSNQIAGTLFGGALVAYSTLPLSAFVLIEAIHIFPQEKYHWYKGDTHIEVTVMKRGFEGYERKMTFWEWEKYNPNIANND